MCEQGGQGPAACTAVGSRDWAAAVCASNHGCSLLANVPGRASNDNADAPKRHFRVRSSTLSHFKLVEFYYLVLGLPVLYGDEQATQHYPAGIRSNREDPDGAPCHALRNGAVWSNHHQCFFETETRCRAVMGAGGASPRRKEHLGSVLLSVLLSGLHHFPKNMLTTVRNSDGRRACVRAQSKDCPCSIVQHAAKRSG